MMFAFRIATSVGIGHLMRMKWLALELQNRGCQSLFILDEQSENLFPFLAEIESELVYLSNSPFSAQEGVQEDAQQCLQLMEKFPDINTIILDSYDLGIEWERVIKSADKKVVVFDDLARQHYCDILFDAKWLGADTPSRYKDKLPDTCRAFLGPQYAILSPAYKNNKNERFLTEVDTKKVLMSLGGGGDLNIIAKLVTVLYQQVTVKNELEIIVVIGPKAENIALVELIAKVNPQVTFLYQPKCLAKYYCQTDLFVGALGTSLYELAATKTPTITFSIAENQQNNYCDLADLGHYFHLSTFDARDAQQVEYFSRLIVSMLDQLPRTRALRAEPTFEVDGTGAVSIVDILLDADSQQIPSAKASSTQYTSDFSDDNERFTLNDSMYIRPVNDKDINHYRQSRNLPNNSERMTIQTEIHPLEHYVWWFNNNRQSYVLYQNEQPLLYIWHQESLVNDKQYIYGGWFTAQGEVPFNVAMLALKWQLEYTQKLFPQGHWLAVINKENKFVNLLNKYMGFSTIAIEDKSFQITQKLFPQASVADFNFVELNFTELSFDTSEE